MAISLPIVGRAVERDVLTAVYASVAAGQPQLLLITGEAGIGKTRLIEDLAKQVTSGGAPPRSGSGSPRRWPGPRWLTARSWPRWESGPHGCWPARHTATCSRPGTVCSSGCSALLGDLAAEAPLVLVLEDLHWADESSHELLAFLAVRLRDLPVLVVATLRDEELADEARRWLSDLERRPRVTGCGWLASPKRSRRTGR